MGLAKSIVSRRLFRLEENLGVLLLARTTRGAALTEAGAAFRNHAAKVCAQLDAAREELLPSGDLRGRLRVAAPASFGPAYFAPALVEIARLHPQLHVNARFSDRYVDLVAEGYDCGIRVGYLPDSNLIARRIGGFSVSLFASPNYVAQRGAPSLPDEINAHPAVMIGTESWTFKKEGKSVTIHAQGRFKSDSVDTIAKATAAGLGIAALPEVIAEPYLADGSLTHVMSDWGLGDIGVFVVRPPGEQPDRKIRVLAEILAASLTGRLGGRDAGRSDNRNGADR